jgi:hypothetical protein
MMAKYMHLVRWLKSAGEGTADFTQHRPSANKREAIQAANRLKNVALVSAQKIFNAETGEVHWQSNGWRQEWN